jgi:hypothetical protein
LLEHASAEAEREFREFREEEAALTGVRLRS